MAPGADDAALVSRARSGSREEREAAFAEIFSRLRQPLLSLCLHLCGTRAEAEDALQETFLALHEGLPRFRGECALSTWAYRIALRIALRVKARRPPTEPPPEDAPAPHGAAALEARAEANRVLRALARLPAEQRAVLSLFAVEGLSHKEIAAVLAIPEGTVWSRLHLARKRLAVELGE